MSEEKVNVLFWMGPTGAGKSGFALDASRNGLRSSAIVNCDSVQFYKDFCIGSAMPSQEDRNEIEHHLFDYVVPPKPMTAGIFVREYDTCISKLIDNEIKIIHVVGGTGFYFRAAEFGMLEVPPAQAEIQQEIETEIASKGSEYVWKRLSEVDLKTSQKISPNDHFRLVRALEVYRSTGKSLSQWKQEHEIKKTERLNSRNYKVTKIGLKRNRKVHSSFIRKRTEIMLEMGLIEEVESLQKKYPFDWPPFGSVGYDETLKFLKGEITNRDSLVDAITMNTMRLVKKQETWFNADPDINWFEPEAGDEILTFVRKTIES